MKYKLLLIVFSITAFIQLNAQCAMCRAVLETEEGQTAAQGLNDGIIYLMAIPYILVFGIGYIIYRKFNKSNK